MNLEDFLGYYDVDVPVEIESASGTAFYGYTNDKDIFDTVVDGKRFEDLYVVAFSVSAKDDGSCLSVLVSSAKEESGIN